ncbi:MAG: carboxylating nicotinate-nucleotide diphosphorylase [Bacteroidetes bacterium]|nr:MAG: carboxylating nicotinate-nucleotide diphosphorylase [Bacteroidota bacterium]MBL1144646.1 carboxylating nicotinate-nucleotide diphosphorylase [Bacteroidota bacterium]NOG57441.1 carboxylating nicotinate-nucleotide diphosphorylase [Bacteroidota bacterium]
MNQQTSIEQLIKLALKEDIGDGDHTALSCIPNSATGKAQLLIKDIGIIAGIEIAEKVFSTVDPNLVFHRLMNDGETVKVGDIAFTIEGKSQSILMGERLALNYMQRMSGIATHTNYLNSLLKGLNTKVLDTRKTTPGFRVFEKMAVKIGGGVNHRFGLYDMIMIKDNHIDYAGGIKEAIYATKNYLQNNNIKIKIEVEARNLNEVQQILESGKVDRIMLDNFTYEELTKAVQLISDRAETEASGGITEQTIRKYAECGVDYISVGALTHQIKSLDMSLKAL